LFCPAIQHSVQSLSFDATKLLVAEVGVVNDMRDTLHLAVSDGPALAVSGRVLGYSHGGLVFDIAEVDFSEVGVEYSAQKLLVFESPNPASTVSLRVKGNSMSPLILDGYIIAVDTSDVSRDGLLGQIVVAWNIEKGLLVSRLMRFDHTEVLVSDDRAYESVVLAADSRWRIVGRVLWWTGRVR
jgi:peptidase S24-like protein